MPPKSTKKKTPEKSASVTSKKSDKKTKDKTKKDDASTKSKKSNKDSVKALDESQNLEQKLEVIENSDFNLCIIHQEPLTHYCYSCEEPICYRCAAYGPHNNQLHRVVEISVAYKSSVSQISHLLSCGLVQKRDLL